MLYEFPQTLRFVLIDNVDPAAYRFLDVGPILRDLIAFVFFLEGSHFIFSIQDDSNFVDVVVVGEVHVAIRLHMVYPQAVIVVNFVAILLVRSV